MSYAVSYSLQARIYTYTVHNTIYCVVSCISCIYREKIYLCWQNCWPFVISPYWYDLRVLNMRQKAEKIQEYFLIAIWRLAGLTWIICTFFDSYIANKIADFDTVMDSMDRTRDFCPDNDSEPTGGNAQPGGLSRPQPDQTSLRQNPGGGRICRQRRRCDHHHRWRHRHYSSGAPYNSYRIF